MKFYEKVFRDYGLWKNVLWKYGLWKYHSLSSFSSLFSFYVFPPRFRCRGVDSRISISVRGGPPETTTFLLMHHLVLKCIFLCITDLYKKHESHYGFVRKFYFYACFKVFDVKLELKNISKHWKLVLVSKVLCNCLWLIVLRTRGPVVVVDFIYRSVSFFAGNEILGKSEKQRKLCRIFGKFWKKKNPTTVLKRFCKVWKAIVGFASRCLTASWVSVGVPGAIPLV